MKQDWIDEVKRRIAEKAEISAKRCPNLETLASRASKKLGLKPILKQPDEGMIQFTRRLVKHFGLGHEFDKQPSDYFCRLRIRAEWAAYRNR